MVSDVRATADPPSCTGPCAGLLPVEMLLPPVLIHITVQGGLSGSSAPEPRYFLKKMRYEFS